MHRLLITAGLGVALLAAAPAGSGLAASVADLSAGDRGATDLAAADLSAADLSGAGLSGAGLPAAGSWAWPVAAPHPVVRPFIAPATPYSAGHRGIDIRSPGPEILAPAAGVVSFAGTVVDRPVLSIRHPGGLVSSYEPVETSLAAGDAVSRGQVVGILLPGHCASPCLHFGVRLDGEYISPLTLLGAVPRSILLPTRGG